MKKYGQNVLIKGLDKDIQRFYDKLKRQNTPNGMAKKPKSRSKSKGTKYSQNVAGTALSLPKNSTSNLNNLRRWKV